jgi:tetrapyrrole methylase family protein/MazG family protein
MEAAAPAGDGPVPSSQQGERVLDLLRVQAQLRAPGGCPWDAEQTHRTLARHLLEESHELLAAIEADDDDAIREELGDLLLQVTFHAQIASDEGRWDIDDVAEALVAKLVHRHPHVFGDVEVEGADEVLRNWEQLKVEEKGEQALEHDVPASLPALARAAKIQRRAEARGFGWRDVEGPLGALREEVEELAAEVEAGTIERDRAEAELGDVLFAAVALGRALGVDGETALRRTTRTFVERYERFEELAAERGVEIAAADPEELRALFREAR